VLNIGFQTTQKSQEVIQGGLAQASATMEVDGSVIAMGNATRLHNVTFYVKPTPGNTDVDLNQDKLVITWTSKNKYSQNIYDGTKATVTSVFSADTDKILKFGDKYKIYVNLKSAGVNDELQANNDFKIELKPQTGSVLTVARRLPPATEAVMFLG
jgi:archaellin